MRPTASHTFGMGAPKVCAPRSRISRCARCGARRLLPSGPPGHRISRCPHQVGHPMSENAHPRADEVDSFSTSELVELMHREDARGVEAVRAALDAIAAAVDQVADRLRSGGRLHYFGAGTSGRLAALDAAECPATFGVADGLVQAHDAGDGEAEDDAGKGRDEARRAGLESRDAVVGISASGSTAY